MILKVASGRRSPLAMLIGAPPACLVPCGAHHTGSATLGQAGASSLSRRSRSSPVRDEGQRQGLAFDAAASAGGAEAHDETLLAVGERSLRLRHRHMKISLAIDEEIGAARIRRNTASIVDLWFGAHRGSPSTAPTVGSTPGAASFGTSASALSSSIASPLPCIGRKHEIEAHLVRDAEILAQAIFEGELELDRTRLPARA